MSKKTEKTTLAILILGGLMCCTPGYLLAQSTLPSVTWQLQYASQLQQQRDDLDKMPANGVPAEEPVITLDQQIQAAKTDVSDKTKKLQEDAAAVLGVFNSLSIKLKEAEAAQLNELLGKIEAIRDGQALTLKQANDSIKTLKEAKDIVDVLVYAKKLTQAQATEINGYIDTLLADLGAYADSLTQLAALEAQQQTTMAPQWWKLIPIQVGQYDMLRQLFEPYTHLLYPNIGQQRRLNNRNNFIVANEIPGNNVIPENNLIPGNNLTATVGGALIPSGGGANGTFGFNVGLTSGAITGGAMSGTSATINATGGSGQMTSGNFAITGFSGTANDNSIGGNTNLSGTAPIGVGAVGNPVSGTYNIEAANTGSMLTSGSATGSVTNIK